MKATPIPNQGRRYQRRPTKATLRRRLLRGILLTDTALLRRVLRRTRATKAISTGVTLRRNTSSPVTTIITITRLRMMAASLS
ncbi:hypothetical protein RchiOBHm_Chr2g0176301 [Rosa chinensis]|uniref:Uncharacterized protein n=1 Tax=Rosa chinensis TaxID=74649 RepID=A0A2P6S6M0_ROSCH|nr:hypothetical protein RchiOBHm_Chr2g0176301 [Rosa chinensis]